MTFPAFFSGLLFGSLLGGYATLHDGKMLPLPAVLLVLSAASLLLIAACRRGP